MKTLIIVCIMGLLSIFDCKSDGERKRYEVLGPEMINQALWMAPGLAWYNHNTNVAWVGDGVKLNCSGINGGTIGQDGFLYPRGQYWRVIMNITYVSGWVEMTGGGTINDGRKYSSGGYDFQVNYGGHFEFDLYSGDSFGTWWIDSSMFVGSIDSLSLRRVDYYYIDE